MYEYVSNAYELRTMFSYVIFISYQTKPVTHLIILIQSKPLCIFLKQCVFFRGCYHGKFENMWFIRTNFLFIRNVRPLLLNLSRDQFPFKV